MKRILVDMSATLIHHGHIRLINKASNYGKVIVALTSDKEVFKHKGYEPELSFVYRKEILEAIKNVDEVIKSPWKIEKSFLEKNNIDLLVHGNDNSNEIDENKLLIFERTKGVSSSELRERALKSILFIKNKKNMLTPGPAQILYENIQYLDPSFGRGDVEFEKKYIYVTNWVKKLSGQEELIISQGASTFSIELGLKSFVSGKVLLINTGFYSNRLKQLADSKNCNIEEVVYDNIETVIKSSKKYDWIILAYTETSFAFKIEIEKIVELKKSTGAKVFADATASIGLEKNHEVFDACAFSSCKGLLGLTGASFLAFKTEIKYIKQSFIESNNNPFYFNIETHKNKLITGPYHSLCSLYGVSFNHSNYVSKIKTNKQNFIDKYRNNLINKEKNQPLLCTLINKKIEKSDKNTIYYEPRVLKEGTSVVCHFNKIHLEY